MYWHHYPTFVGTILLLVTAFICPGPCRADENYEVILNQGVHLNGGETLTAHDGKCKLTLETDGNLKTLRIPDHYSSQHRVAWSTGSLEEGEYYAVLDTGTGMLRIWDASSQVHWNPYRTQPFDDQYYAGGHHPYRLIMDENCVLSILVQENSSDVVIWSNVRRHMTNGDVLQRGDILQGYHNMASCPDRDGPQYYVRVPMFLSLEHDCNVVQYVGNDYADDGDLVWTPDVAQPHAENCYIFVDQDFVGLFEGSFDHYERDMVYPERTGLYWHTESGNWEETMLYGDNGFWAD